MTTIQVQLGGETLTIRGENLAFTVEDNPTPTVRTGSSFDFVGEEPFKTKVRSSGSGDLDEYDVVVFQNGSAFCRCPYYFHHGIAKGNAFFECKHILSAKNARRGQNSYLASPFAHTHPR